MTTNTTIQADLFKEFSELYFEQLKSFHNEVSSEVKTDVRDAWTTFTETAGVSGATADLVAIGALVPVIAMIQEHGAESAEEIVRLMILSLLDANQ